MEVIDYVIPILLGVFFMSQYFNKRHSNDRKKFFLIVGVLIVLINILIVLINS